MPAPAALVTISFWKSGIQPPVFVAGSFTDPAWQLREMQCTTDDSGMRHFSTQVLVRPGQEYRYKFKAGESQDWVLDEHSSVVTDDQGNTANLLKVPSSPSPSLRRLGTVDGMADGMAEPEASSVPMATTAAQVADTAARPDDPDPAMPQRLDAKCLDEGDAADDDGVLHTPLFAHESFGACEAADDGFRHRDYHGDVKSLELRLSLAGDDADVDDPTLEKFPCERSSVLDTLRKIRSSHDENRLHLEDLQRSPREAPGRSSVDSCNGNGPVACAQMRENRLSHSSVGPLGSIAEEPGGVQDRV